MKYTYRNTKKTTIHRKLIIESYASIFIISITSTDNKYNMQCPRHIFVSVYQACTDRCKDVLMYDVMTFWESGNKLQMAKFSEMTIFLSNFMSSEVTTK